MTMMADGRPHRLLDVVATIVACILLAAGLFAAFLRLDGWAASNFARPLLASALLAVADLALFLVAIALAPLLSSLLRKLGSLALRRR
jgi:hypothetical protein